MTIAATAAAMEAAASGCEWIEGGGGVGDPHKELESGVVGEGGRGGDGDIGVAAAAAAASTDVTPLAAIPPSFNFINSYAA